MPAVTTDVELDRIVEVMILGLSADPVMRWLYPSSRAYLQNFPTLLTLFGGGAFEAGVALGTEDGSAAALWLAPNCHPDEEGLKAHFESALPAEVREDAYANFDLMERYHPDAPCWHLAFVATDPPSRGQGCASALIAHVLARCDANREIAYLENTNPANTSLYERHGFEVVGEIQAGRSPPMLAMRRDPVPPAGLSRPR